MTEEWRDEPLGDLVQLQRGFDLPTHKRKSGSVPVVASTGIVGHHDQPMVRGPGVVIGRSGSIGGAQYIDKDFWPLNTTLWVKDFKGSNPKFVYYLLKSIDFSAYNAGAAVPTLNRNHIYEIIVRRPQLYHQEAIAGVLGALDDKIDQDSRMCVSLESIARALFKSWFVDFDPVRAKAEGKKPFGMDDETASLFPDSFEGSELGEIPRGWEAVALPEVLDVNPRRTITRGSDASYLDMKNMPTTGHRPTGWIRKAFKSGSRFINGDTLVARITPCLENGKTAYVDFLMNNEVGWGSTEFIVLRPKPPLPTEYGYLFARSEEFRAYAIQSMTGSSGRQRVAIDSLDDYLVVKSTKELSECFGAFVRPMMKLAKVNSEQSMTLAQIRDALLPKLLSGEIQMPKDKTEAPDKGKVGAQ